MLEIGVGTGARRAAARGGAACRWWASISPRRCSRKLVEKAGGSRRSRSLRRRRDAAAVRATTAFGAAVVRHVLHLVPGWRQVVAELVASVAPGGTGWSSTRRDPGGVARADGTVHRDRVGAPVLRRLSTPGRPARSMSVRGARRRATRRFPTITERVGQTARGVPRPDGGRAALVDVGGRRGRRVARLSTEVRAWALERYGTLDPPGARDVTIEWRAYDLLADRPLGFPDPPSARYPVDSSKEGPVPITEVEKIWMDGELVPWQDAQIHVLSPRRALRQRRLRGHPGVRDRARRRRLAPRRAPEAAVPLREALPHRDPVLARGDHAGHEGRDPRERLDACYVRPLVLRGYGEMGVNPLEAPVNVVIAVWPWGAYLGEDALEQGVRIKVSSWRRNGAELAAGGREGDRAVHQLGPREGREPEGRLRRGDHAERGRLRDRRLGRERVRRPGRRARPRRRSRPGASTGSRAAR